jgi:C1A family cysteine protease
MRSLKLLKVLVPALGLVIIYTACKKEQSATVENNSNTESNLKLSGVAPDDPAVLAKIPVMMSSEFFQKAQTSARKQKPSTQPTDTTTTTPPPTTVIPPTTLPASYQLVCPTPGNQGGENSCVGWATAQARSIEQYYRTKATGYSYATNMFSPEYIYNQIQTGCGSSTITDALYLLVNKGVCTWQTMPYSSTNGCSLMPTSSQYAEAANYKIASYSLIYSSDITAIKSSIAANHPLVTGAVIDDNFYNAGPGYIWNSTGTLIMGHAISIVGYDDSKHAFKAMNSWGTNWADGGFIWIDYTFFSTICYELFRMN